MTIEEAFATAAGLHQAGKTTEAEEIYRRIIQLQPNSPMALNNLASILMRRQQMAEAIDLCQTALKLQPDLAEAHVNLSQAYVATGRVEEGIQSLKRTLALRPELAEGWNNLGNAYMLINRFADGLAMFERASALEPTWPHIQSNLGKARQANGDVDGAIAALRKSVAVQPNLQVAHLNLGIALLLRGDFQEGWREYEWRWHTREFDPQKKKFAQPAWLGSNLNGQRILLFNEQGFGDTLQFVRYAKLVADRGGHVILECQQQLFRLMQNASGVAEIATPGSEPPPFDTHCPLMSLPAIFATDLPTIPATVPYLRASPQMIDRWKSRLAGDQTRFKVGLAWAGGPKDVNRTIPLKQLSPLFQIEGISFFSVQVGPPVDEVRATGLPIVTFEGKNRIEDFADTAGLISQLDLIITIDSAVAHLAGAMGKPVWLLLRFAPDWRWLLDRADSPWYPTMRLFRQKKISDWETPIREVAEALAIAAKSRAH